MRGARACVALFAFLLVLSAPGAALAASPSTTSSVPSASTASVGDAVTDTATVTGDPLVGAAPTGAVHFFLCGPPNGVAGCASGATDLGSASLSPSSGTTAQASSSSFILTSPGTWCFRADYTGDTNYDPSSDGSAAECFTVGQASSATASTPQQGPITLGQQNADAATVTGNAGGGAPSGTVSFHVCGPLSSGGGCTTGGTEVGSAPLSPSSGNTATATSPSFRPTTPGTWCFRADYSGDTDYGGSGDGSSGECFAVGQAAAATASTPQQGSLTLGAQNTDAATVTGSSGGGAPSGTVSFHVCGPLSTAAGCATGGTDLGSASLSAGSGNTATASSPPFTPTSAGTWCFRADYSGDTNYGGSSDSSSGECFTVGQASALTASTPQTGSITLGAQNADAGTVTGSSGGGAPSGTVSFHVCGPLSTAAGCATGGTDLGSASLSPGSGDTATATSPSYAPSSPGTWCFRADYSGDANYGGSSDGSSGECFTVGQASSTTVSAPQQGPTALGGQNTDVAKVIGTAGGGTPSGTVSFFVCGPPSSAAGCASGGTPVGSAPLSPGGVNAASATSPPFTPTSPGTWCFRADYSGDTNYGGSSDGSNGECFTIGQGASSTASAPQRAATTLGASNADAATVNGNAAGGSPSGTVSFHVCGPLGSATGCDTGGTAVGSASLSPGSGNTATAASPPFTAKSTGTWCFRADYSGDTNYSGSGDSSGVECFTVAHASSSTASTPGQRSIMLGSRNTDTATVTGSTGGGPPTGKVSFHVCGPLDSAGACATGGSTVGAPVTLGPGSGNTADAASPTFTPTSTGTWCFRADYSGDANQYNPSGDSSSGGCFTVVQAPSSTASTPQQVSIREGDGNSDSVTVTGAPDAKAPTGTVSFRVCGPLSSRSGCAGGVAVGTASLSPGSGNTATAGSPSFTPTSAGTWCFRADYSGDSNYHPSSDGSSGECFTVALPDAPTATIGSPPANATYRKGQAVTASYKCTEAHGGPGIASCAGTVANGASIDTSPLGPHTFSVTARSYDGLSTTVVDGYRVAAPPLVAISSPAQGATYTRGQSVGVSFSCAEGSFGSGLAMCSGPSAFATSKPGTYGFTVTADSTDGQRSTRTVYFRVVLPSNRFKVSHLRRRGDGRMTFQLIVPSAGAVDVLETASGRTTGRASRRRRPARWVMARLHMTPRKAGMIHVTVRPNARGKSIAHQSVDAALIRLVVTYTPVNGTPRTTTFSGRQIGS